MRRLVRPYTLGELLDLWELLTLTTRPDGSWVPIPLEWARPEDRRRVRRLLKADEEGRPR